MQEKATWYAGLWIDNDEGMYRAVLEIVESSDDYASAEATIKELIEENNPLAEGADMFTDLLGYIMSFIDYESLVDDKLEVLENGYPMPDGVEIFEMTYEQILDLPAADQKQYMVDGIRTPGWYWWYCQPGCLPTSDPVGPFDARYWALKDADNETENVQIDDGEDEEDD